MQINWSIRELDVFLALAATLSFRRTAAQVNLSQSAVSGVITRLEDTLAVRLFDRTTRHVQLTATGQVFAEQALLLRAQTDEAVRAVRNVVELQSGKVTLAALPSLAATVVPAACARFSAQHPGIQFRIVDTLSGPAFDLVRAGQVDFALTAANPAYADLDYQPLASDGFVLLIPPGHALAQGNGPLRWIDVAALTHISMPLPASVRQYADAALLEHRLRFAPTYEVEHLATITAMVACGLGVAALPELAAAVAPQPGVVRRRLVEPDISRPIGLVTRRYRSLSPAATALVDMLREEMARVAPRPRTTS
ncbi:MULTISPECIES: LysR family transcriptional regulator [unclassified Polaromonas]|uniref:LysR family transcriptional regulator n=1 Tax=unclassified Polaromonas TaxID=2638319 RepID=UPI0018CBE168|nr:MULTISPECIES: LysR family transcriptional regulator [unclassified Polaromonas]MBG6070821.1 DNA-binding transcriptional LysR family regulator [Polaromonas sp. CG_9.7]MBG6112869.1 DNA-binding transcriptional LysR family regulator [Polaromonas sp. CG_9.2]